jgi:pimeloyl-ACP methyl ester carboxylesterase
MHTTLSRSEPSLEGSQLEPAPFKEQTGGVFASLEARGTLMALYDSKLSEWPVHHEEFDVPTRYGQSHVVAAGHPAAPPLLMVHMCAAPSFVWAPIVAPLAARFRIYAVDTIGDISKSVLVDPARYPTSGDELAGWLREVADALKIDRSDVVAGSYGGWLGMHYATYASSKVRRLALLVPMGLPSWAQTVRVLFRLGTILIGQSPSKLEHALSWMMGDDRRVRRLVGDWMTKVVALKCKARLARPWPVSAKRLAAIRVPTLVVLGGRDVLIGDAQAAAQRARRHIPNVQIEIVPNATHAAHAEEPERVAQRLIEFFA